MNSAQKSKKNTSTLATPLEFQFPQLLKGSNEFSSTTTTNKKAQQTFSNINNNGANGSLTSLHKRGGPGDLSKSSTGFFGRKVLEESALSNPGRGRLQSNLSPQPLDSRLQVTNKPSQQPEALPVTKSLQQPSVKNSNSIPVISSASKLEERRDESPLGFEEDDPRKNLFTPGMDIEAKYGMWISSEKMMFYAKRYNRDFTNGLLERDKILSLHKLSQNKNFSNLSNLVIRDFFEGLEFPSLKQLNLR